MECRICSSTDLKLVLSLGLQPWCNDFRLPSEPQIKSFADGCYPLNLVYCPKCGLTQLDYTVKKETMFKNHTYVSGTTKTLAAHFYNLAADNKLQYNLQKDDLIVDIGGNDGTQLLQYAKLGFKNLLNVESAGNIAAISMSNGINTANAYFNEDFVKELTDWVVNDAFYGTAWPIPTRAKLINASGVFFHLEELHSVCRGVKRLLDDEGVFVVQFMYLKDIVENATFDAIYHEHLCYYTLNSLMYLMDMHGMTLQDAHPSSIHGGSMIAKFVHKDSGKPRTWRAQKAVEEEGNVGIIELEKFAQDVFRKQGEIQTFLLDLKKQGKKIYGYGAPAKSTTMMCYCGIDHTILDKVVEVNEMKIGRMTPLTQVPIVQENDDDLPDVYLVFCWNFAAEVFRRKAHLLDKVTFVLPLPEIAIYGKLL